MRLDHTPRIFSIPTGTPFLEAFVAAFLSGQLTGTGPLTPQTIAATRIYLPTRRAAQALLATLAAAGKGRAMLLPKVLPLGDSEQLEEEAAIGMVAPLGLPEAIEPIDRRLHLFDLVMKWRNAIAARQDEEGNRREPFFVASQTADAFALSGDLARLIDEMIIEQVPLQRLSKGMPEKFDFSRHDQYWSITAKFLEIAATAWPQMLAEQGVIDRVDRRNQLIGIERQKLISHPPLSPVIIAGSTGSVAATADLMAAVARLPAGAVVLPGLDIAMDDDSWQVLQSKDAALATRYAHPQSILRRTLERLGVRRNDVIEIPENGSHGARAKMLSEAFRPAETTECWSKEKVTTPLPSRATDGLMLLEASDEGEEALAIAIVMREVLEKPDKTAALVTPDRNLARRVQGELRRWGVEVSDSAGSPLANTSIARLSRLLLMGVSDQAGSVGLLALMRDPLTRLGQAPSHRQVSTIELIAMRGKRNASGLDALKMRLKTAAKAGVSGREPAPMRRIEAEDLIKAQDYLTALQYAIAPLDAVFLAGKPTLKQAAAAHLAALRYLVAVPPEEDHPLETPEGLALIDLIESLSEGRLSGPKVTLHDYSAIFEQLLAEKAVKSGLKGHPRLKIWGLLEARLLEVDRLILGGLNEGVWPPEARSDPFLNRPMRIAIDLQPPERRIGQTAHDFMMLMGAPDVVVSHARKRDGAPGIQSRFLRRLGAYLGAPTMEELTQRGEATLVLARLLDQPTDIAPCARPSPVPPSEMTPEKLSLTEIETLYRDPYVLYARHILKLDPLPALDPPLEARERGTLIHTVIERYAGERAGAAPEKRLVLLMEIARQEFLRFREEDPESAWFWWRRFEGFAPDFIQWDEERRARASLIHAERKGSYTLDLHQGRHMQIRTKADRIEQQGGAAAIIDFKSGTIPGKNEVAIGLAPQLTLTGALLKRGAFTGIPAMAANELAYVKVGGAFEVKSVNFDFDTLEKMMEEHLGALQNHLNRHIDGKIGYLSHRRPKKTSYASDYDHLARHLEWSLGGDEEGEE